MMLFSRKYVVNAEKPRNVKKTCITRQKLWIGRFFIIGYGAKIEKAGRMAGFLQEEINIVILRL